MHVTTHARAGPPGQSLHGTARPAGGGIEANGATEPPTHSRQLTTAPTTAVKCSRRPHIWWNHRTGMKTAAMSSGECNPSSAPLSMWSGTAGQSGAKRALVLLLKTHCRAGRPATISWTPGAAATTTPTRSTATSGSKPTSGTHDKNA
eukprot:1435933-Pyramimonas_sp.AAC.1